MKNTALKHLLRDHLNLWFILGIITIELIFLKIAIPSFISLNSIIGFGRQSAIISVLAIGMCIILISGGFDLSVGAIVSLLGMVAALLFIRFNIPLLPVCIIIIVLGGSLGFLNGSVCAKVRIHPFILTTALSVVYRGTANIVNNGMPMYGLPASLLKLDRYALLGVPLSLIILILCFVFGAYILRKTYLGKYIYAIGLDEKTAEYAGIDSKLIKKIVYSISGMFYGIASILLLTKIGSAQPNAMTGIELDLLVAAAIGGISFKGGRGRLLNIILGVLLMEIFADTLIIFNVGEYYRSIFKGLVLLAALFMDGVIRTGKEKS